MDTTSSGIIREDHAPVSSPVTPTPKRRNGAAGAEVNVTGDANGVESQTMAPDKLPQPDVDKCGSSSHAEALHQALAQIQPIPFRIPVSNGQTEDNQDDDPFGGAGLYGNLDATRCEQNIEAIASTDVVDENVASLAQIDAGQAEDSTTNDFVAPVAIDQEPHELSHELSREQLDEISQELSRLHKMSQELSRELSQEQFHEQPCEQSHEDHGANTAASILATSFTTETEPEKVETAVSEEIGRDMQTTPLPQTHLNSPTQSSGTPHARPASPKGEQVEQAPAESASNDGPAASNLGAPNALVTSPIPSQYGEVGNPHWFKETVTESQPAPEARPAPRTPSPKKPPRKAPVTSGARRTRASKKTPSKVPAEIDTWSPPVTRSAKKRKAEEESAAPAASPPPRVTPIKKITLHFKRKQKVETDCDPAPEPEDEDESNHESLEASGGRVMEHGYFYDVDGDEPDADAGDDAYADAEEDVDVEEEIMLL